MRKRVREILSWYSSDNPGTLSNLDVRVDLLNPSFQRLTEILHQVPTVNDLVRIG